MTLKDSDRWIVRPGDSPDLASLDPRSTDGVKDKPDAEARFSSLHQELSGLQERLWAERRQSLLIVLQAMDAGGKDGAIKHLFRGLNPAGSAVASFKVPTVEELAHDFLWRVHKRTPAAGELVFFNRSHYEDVLVVRVNELVPETVWRPRYELIKDFERNLFVAGTRIVKVFLHISNEEQAERLQARVDDPTKRWKFRLGDLEDRGRWDGFQSAYEEAIIRTSVEESPWFIVPGDRKWYRNWAVSRIVIETLEDMDPRYPPNEEVIGVTVE